MVWAGTAMQQFTAKRKSHARRRDVSCESDGRIRQAVKLRGRPDVCSEGKSPASGLARFVNTALISLCTRALVWMLRVFRVGSGLAVILQRCPVACSGAEAPQKFLAPLSSSGLESPHGPHGRARLSACDSIMSLKAQFVNSCAP